MKKLLALLCASWSVPAGAAYVPNATEQAVLEAVLRDEVVSFSTGGHSFVGESQGIVPVTAASASQAMAARDRNARMPELKQPLLLSARWPPRAASRGRASGSISPIPPRPRCARAWRRARPWRASPRPVRRWPWSAARWSWPGHAQLQRLRARRRRRRARGGKAQERLGRVLPGQADRCKGRHAGDQHLAVRAGTAGRQRLSRRPGALRGVHRGGQAAEPGAQERRIAACARPAWT